MKMERTLQWFQKQAGDEHVRVNVQTTVTDDAGAVLSQSGQDLTVTSELVLAAVDTAEKAIADALDVALPVITREGE